MINIKDTYKKNRGIIIKRKDDVTLYMQYEWHMLQTKSTSEILQQKHYHKHMDKIYS